MIATAVTATKNRNKGGWRQVKILTCRFAVYILPVSLALGGCAAELETPATGVDFYMDTVVEQRWYGPDKEALLDAVREAMGELEARTSLYREDSDIQSINASAGRNWVRVSREVYDLVRRGREYSEESWRAGGSVDITAGPLSLLWDVTGESSGVPDAASIRDALELVDYNDILLDEENCAVMLRRPGQVLDLGALVKGYACDVIRELRKQYDVTSGYASVGSNLICAGKKPDGSGYSFGIRDPAAGANDYIGRVDMPAANPKTGTVWDVMAVSGTYERYFERDGVVYHHIFDLQDGYPVEKGLVSVTVFTGDGLRSDYLSTHLMTQGVPGVLSELDNPEYGFVAIAGDGTVYVSEHLQDLYTHTAEEQEYRLYEA